MAEAPVPEMRDWGVVRDEELQRIVVVSPHLDDAVLGCSYLLARCPGTSGVTIFAGRPSRYPDPMERLIWGITLELRPWMLNRFT